jgi:hypothetical protein
MMNARRRDMALGLEHAQLANESERRRAPRRRMLKQVQILSLDKKSTSAIDCTLRSISRTGAMLSGVRTSLGRIPSPFYLVVPGQLRMIRCKVIWHSYDEIGVKFLSEPGAVASEWSGCGDYKPACVAGGKEQDPLSSADTPAPPSEAAVAKPGVLRELGRRIVAALNRRASH